MAFMLICASNFALHYLAWSNRSLAQYWRNTEFRAFLAIYALLGSTVCATLYFCSSYSSLGSAIREGLFTVIAYGTSTGFTITNPSGWPLFTPLLLVLITFFGGCAGGTGGGVKVIRLVLFIKQAGRETRHLIHPSRSEEHTSELQSLMRISYAVLCLK